jgi:hypothetical protein
VPRVAPASQAATGRGSGVTACRSSGSGPMAAHRAASGVGQARQAVGRWRGRALCLPRWGLRATPIAPSMSALQLACYPGLRARSAMVQIPAGEADAAIAIHRWHLSADLVTPVAASGAAGVRTAWAGGFTPVIGADPAGEEGPLCANGADMTVTEVAELMEAR